MDPLTISVCTLGGEVNHKGQVLRLQLPDDVGYADLKETLAMHLHVPEITFDVIFDPPASEGTPKYSEGLWPPRARCFQDTEVRHYGVTIIYRDVEFVDALRLLRAIFQALPTGRHCDVRLRDLMRNVPMLERYVYDPVMLAHLAHHTRAPSGIQFESLLCECTAMDVVVKQSESLCRTLVLQSPSLVRYMDADLFLDPNGVCRRLLEQRDRLWLHLPPLCYDNRTLMLWLVERVMQTHLMDFFRVVSPNLKKDFAMMKAFLGREPCLLEQMHLDHLTVEQECDLLDCATNGTRATCILQCLSFDRMQAPVGQALALAWIRVINTLPVSHQRLLGRHQVALCFLEPALLHKPRHTFWHEALECVGELPPPRSGMIAHAIMLQPRVLNIFRHKLTDSQDRVRVETLRRAAVRSLRTLLAKCLVASGFEKKEERELLNIIEWSNPWGEAKDGENLSD